MGQTLLFGVSPGFLWLSAVFVFFLGVGKVCHTSCVTSEAASGAEFRASWADISVQTSQQDLIDFEEPAASVEDSGEGGAAFGAPGEVSLEEDAPRFDALLLLDLVGIKEEEEEGIRRARDGRADTSGTSAAFA